MKEGRPSFSAEVVAAMRALESRKPEHLRICNDPYAKHLIRPSFRLLAQSRLITKLGLKYIEKRGPGFPAGIAARTRYIDDIVKKEVAAGAVQVVILGAGLDARAFRLRELQKIRVFEVDFPATQAYKHARLKKLKHLPKDHITYVPIDFNKDDLEIVLEHSGYNPNLRTVFTWEGVTMYLDAEAVDRTLAFIATNKAKGSTLYFDYFRQAVLDGTCQHPESVELRKTTSFGGAGIERYTFGIDEETIREFLHQRGFKLLEHQTGETLKDRYFKGQNRNKHVFRICGFVHAELNTEEG